MGMQFADATSSGLTLALNAEEPSTPPRTVGFHGSDCVSSSPATNSTSIFDTGSPVPIVGEIGYRRTPSLPLGVSKGGTSTTSDDKWRKRYINTLHQTSRGRTPNTNSTGNRVIISDYINDPVADLYAELMTGKKSLEIAYHCELTLITNRKGVKGEVPVFLLFTWSDMYVVQNMETVKETNERRKAHDLRDRLEASKRGEEHRARLPRLGERENSSFYVPEEHKSVPPEQTFDSKIPLSTLFQCSFDKLCRLAFGLSFQYFRIECDDDLQLLFPTRDKGQTLTVVNEIKRALLKGDGKRRLPLANDDAVILAHLQKQVLKSNALATVRLYALVFREGSQGKEPVTLVATDDAVFLCCENLSLLTSPNKTSRWNRAAPRFSVIEAKTRSALSQLHDQRGSIRLVFGKKEMFSTELAGHREWLLICTPKSGTHIKAVLSQGVT